MSVIIDVKDLFKTYKTPFSRKLVHAVRGVSFEVRRGEAFGFLGPNGAGKTTTIRMLMGLIKPSAGDASLFGMQIGQREATKKLGFLPEAPYFYEYLSVSELLDLAGRLFGISSKVRRKRGEELIELVGLKHAAKSPLKSYSKGMMQRAGIAQALINDPELVVFDEPMSGLDPVGRKEVREIILNLRERGKTIFFSSHILTDVEILAERVAIVAKGKVRKIGRLEDLSSTKSSNKKIEFECETVEKAFLLERELNEFGAKKSGRRVTCKHADGDGVNPLPLSQLIEDARSMGGRLNSVTPDMVTLEDVFMTVAMEANS